jgi:5-methylcytosine-specific restriction endonuclease McrA
VYVRDNFTCQDCERKFSEEPNYRGAKIEGLTLGHVIPRCLGGLFTPENLRAQCYDCNQKLGNKIWAKELRRALTNYVLN